MRAMTNTTYGSPDVLTPSEVEAPTIGAGEVLVQIHASAVTQGDRRLRAADFPGVSRVLGRLFSGVLRPRHPVGGSNFAGRVVEVGADVTRFAVGDDVFGGVMHGAYAEYLAVGQDEAVASMPDGLSYAEAAAIPYGAVTALSFLRDVAKVRRGERVLIVGASGGVGQMGVQVARHLGAHVTGVCSRDAQLVRDLGAHEVIDYRREDFTARDEHWDVIFDTTEGEHFRRFRPSLGETGRYLSLYVTLRVLAQMALGALGRGPRALTHIALGSPALMQDIRALVAAGALRAVVADRYPLGRLADAHAALEATRPSGSLVVEVVQGASQRRTSPVRDGSAPHPRAS